MIDNKYSLDELPPIDTKQWFRAEVELGIYKKTGIKGKLFIEKHYGAPAYAFNFCMDLFAPMVTSLQDDIKPKELIRLFSQWLLEGGGKRAKGEK